MKREIKRLHVEVGLFKGEVDNLQNYIGKCHQEIDSAKTILVSFIGCISIRKFDSYGIW